MSPTAAWPASKPNVPGITPSATTPHMPGIDGSSSASRMWQMLVPMIATSVPGPVTVAAGTETWASTLATATASRVAGPVQPAACSRQAAGRCPDRDDVRDILSSTTDPKPGRAPRRTRVREAVLGGPDRLVAGGAVVPRLDPGQLPDDPVGGLEEPVGRAVGRRAPRAGSGAPSGRTTRTRSCRRSARATVGRVRRRPG